MPLKTCSAQPSRPPCRGARGPQGLCAAPGMSSSPRGFPTTRKITPICGASCAPCGRSRFTIRFTCTTSPVSRYWHLHAPLAPVPTAAPVVVPHHIGQLPFDPGMLLPHGRIAGRRGPRPRRVIFGLVIMLDDTPSLLLGQRGQAPRLLPTPRTLTPGKDKLPAGVVGTALLGRRLLPAGTGHHALLQHPG